MPGFDITIPNYNYGRYLRGCVDSVRMQGVEDLRILIIDNASTDDSARIAQALAAEDNRISLRLRERNLGPHASFNAGIDWAGSDYFLILCADDALAPGALARAAAVLDHRPDINLTYGRVAAFGTDLKPCPDSATWTAVAGADLIHGLCCDSRNYIAGPSVIVRTEAQKALGPYRSHLRHTDDLEMWLRFGAHGNAAYIDAVQAVARVHPLNQSASVPDVLHWNGEFEAAFRSFFAGDGAALRDAPYLLQTALSGLGERAFCSAITGLLKGRRGTRDLLAYSFRHRKWPDKLLTPLGYALRRLGLRQARAPALRFQS